MILTEFHNVALKVLLVAFLIKCTGRENGKAGDRRRKIVQT